MSKFDSKKWQAALALLQERRRQFAEYEEQCAEERKQGYRPSTCFHGTNQWTDYDNICGPCEDGLGWWDFMAQARDCLDMVGRIEAMVSERGQIIRDIAALDQRHRGIDKYKDYGPLLDWVYAPWERV